MEHIEAIAYLKTLLYIASADNSIDDSEMKCFCSIGESLGLSSNDLISIQTANISQTESIETIVREIKEEQTKISLIKELLSLCYIDGEYSLVEQSGMSEICALLNLSDDVLKKLEADFEKQRKSQKDIASWKKSVSCSPFYSTIEKALEVGKNGALSVSQKIVDSSAVLAHSLTSGLGVIGTKISFSIELAKKAKEENRQLREKLKTTNISEAVKQKVILQLNSKIVAMSSQLKDEKQRNKKNEELILLLQAQIDDLSATVDVAQSIEVV